MGARSTKNTTQNNRSDGHLLEYFRNTFIRGGGATNPFSATGGTITEPGNGYKYHFFTASGDFKVSSGSDDIEYLVVAGGGGGDAAGGGSGGVLQVSSPVAGVDAIYTIVVGGGGAGGPGGNPSSGGSPGFPSSAFGYTSIGGGGAEGRNGGTAEPGGSGGGASYSGGGGGFGYNPSTPAPVLSAVPGPQGGPLPFPYTFNQGNPGGTGFPSGGSPPGLVSAGGGGAGGAGTIGNNTLTNAPGGIGLSAFSGDTGIPASYGTPGPTAGRWFAGGGSGRGPAPAGGGGSGYPATPGTTNTGGGGGGAANSPVSTGSGAPGIVIIRYLV